MASIRLKLKSKQHSNGEYPIVLQIIKDRKTKIVSLGLFSKLDFWDDKAGLYKNKYSDSKKLNVALDKIKLKARLIILEFEEDEINFTLEEFEERFRSSSNNNLTVFEFWNEIIDEMENSGKIGNARVNKETVKSIKKFHSNDKLTFNQVNVCFIEKYEVFLRSNGGTNGGIGVRMRALRAIYNRAIRRGIVKKEKYPFNIYKVAKLKGNPTKRALPIEKIREVENLSNLTTNRLINAQNYYLFSFYTRGMNFADMAVLEWSDISDNNIYYTRLKTGVNYVIKILPPVQNILDHYKVNGNHNKYIFPILYREDYTPNQLKNRKEKMLSQYNYDLKHIAKLSDIKKTFTSYTARHSFANCLKQKGVSTDIICESMGHKDILTTQTYLKELGNSTLDNACSILLS